MFSASLPLIWHATRLLSERKKKITFWPHPGLKGVCYGKRFASMLLYASLSLIWYATWPYSEKLGFYISHCDPWSWLIFEQTWSRSTRWCYTPYIKALGLVVSDKKIFSCFPYISLCKTYDPRGMPFLPHRHNLNKLARCPLSDATYQISRLYAVWFQTRRFFHVFPL